MRLNDILSICSKVAAEYDDENLLVNPSIMFSLSKMRYSNLHFVKPIFSAAESVVLVIELALRKPRQLRSK